jgi:hypothetical protein
MGLQSSKLAIEQLSLYDSDQLSIGGISVGIRKTKWIALCSSFLPTYARFVVSEVGIP